MVFDFGTLVKVTVNHPHLVLFLSSMQTFCSFPDTLSSLLVAPLLLPLTQQEALISSGQQRPRQQTRQPLSLLIAPANRLQPGGGAQSPQEGATGSLAGGLSRLFPLPSHRHTHNTLLPPPRPGSGIIGPDAQPHGQGCDAVCRTPSTAPSGQSCRGGLREGECSSSPSSALTSTTPPSHLPPTPASHLPPSSPTVPSHLLPHCSGKVPPQVTSQSESFSQSCPQDSANENLHIATAPTASNAPWRDQGQVSTCSASPKI